jgi:PAS domain S-box-containing protein
MSMRDPLRILSIEDDPKDTELIQNLLETEDIVCEVTRVDTQAALLASLEQGRIDLILADYTLPSFDGISALKLALKACPDVPFIFVSGTLGEEVAIEALKIGATDYVLKTRLSRLVPSVLRALREARAKAERKRAEDSLRQSETYLAEAQRLSSTGSFGWNVASGEIYWSEETYKIFEYDRGVKPTLELAFRRIHPDDRVLVQQTIDRASEARANLDFEHRLLISDGSVKYLHVLARAQETPSGTLEYVGAVTDVTERKRTEEALRRSENYLAEAQRVTHTGSWASDGTTRAALYWSEEMYRIFGFDPQQGFPLRDQWLQRMHPEDRDKVKRQASDRMFIQKEDSEVEFRIVLPDGTVKHIHGLAHPVFNSNKELVEVVGTAVDITERKRAQEALRRSEERHRSVLETATDSVVNVDERGQIIFANPATTKTFGYQISEMIGQPVTMLMPEVMREVHKGGFQRYLKTNQRHVDWRGVQLVGLRKNGEEFPIEVSFGEVLESGHHIFTGFIRDTTERKQAEEKIREREAELRQVLELAPQHINVLGPEGSRLYTNQAALDYYGITLEQWRSCDPSRLFHPDDCERMTSGAQIKFLSASLHETEARLLRKDGKYHWFLFRRNPLRDVQGHILRWYVSATDIEDRKRAEERLRHENVALREEIDKTSMFEEIVGNSPALHAVLSRVSKVAPTDSTVLITGETGTGKELVARAIHRRSHRCSRAFVSVNCAAIPRDLIASELFGHEKGAFTGATQRRLGRFELAEGGTIFLDEVGELPAETQIALLRVLQEHEFERVGGTGSIRANVRVIAATNRDLQVAIAASTFRSDLFYRLNVFPIEVPPLRERKEDIPVLVEYFIDRYASKAGKNIRGVNKKSLELLQTYPWPGNIRELQNVIERSVIVCDTENFSVDESWLSRRPPASQSKTQLELARKPAAKEKEIIEAALRESGGRVYGPSGAASKLGIPRSTLESKIRSLNISKSRFKAIDSSKNS